ncbi:acyl-CoA dehydrogenase family protein [Paracidovorax citrulli]
MRLMLTETQALIEASAMDWLAANAQRVRSAAGPGEYWTELAELGWLALPFAEGDGGLGGGPIEAGLLMRAFGRHRVLGPLYRDSVLTAARIVAELGSAAQREAWLDALMTGERRLAMAQREAAGDAGAMPGTTAAWDSNAGRWTLHGAKSLVVEGAGADGFIVSARIRKADPDNDAPQPRLALFLVPRDACGVALRPCRMADGTHAVDLHLRGVELSAQASLQGAAGPADLAASFHAIAAQALIASCWEAAGAMQAALDATVGHVSQRQQFGRPLSAFQVVQHRLAEMAVCCEEATAACELAALRAAADRQLACRAASMAKSCTGRGARYVGANAVQLHGGMGVSEELQIAALFRLLTRFQIEDGHADWHAARLGNAMLAGDWRESQTLLEPSSSPRAATHPERSEWICS